MASVSLMPYFMKYSPTRQSWIGYLSAILGVAVITLLFNYLILSASQTTVALCFLLIVLITATIGGLGPGIAASIIGVLSFDYYFLGPQKKFVIQDPQNLLDFLVFLVTAVITSQLSSAARLRAVDAEKRREEVWKLYQLSRLIIATPDSEAAVSSIANQVIKLFGVEYCAIFVPEETGRWHQLATTTGQEEPVSFTPVKQVIDKVFRAGELTVSDSSRESEDKIIPTIEKEKTITYVPLKIDTRSEGVMVLISGSLERGTIEAIAGLVALGLERARFLQEVSRTEALRQSDDLKSAILASVSHNLRTPLTSIRASIDNLLQEDLDWDKAALREFHIIISEETYRLTRVVQNLLYNARIEAGELHLSKQWNSISELFDDVMDRCSSAVRDHRVKIDLDDAPPAVKIDHQLLAEVLVNLVENAAKYSPADSEITIKAQLQNEELLVSVTDQGQGVLPDEIEHIFDKFYRGTQLSDTPIQGTGMGLAIARGIIEAHNGKIWAESKLGQGATFKFSIPIEYKNMAEFILTNGEL